MNQFNDFQFISELRSAINKLVKKLRKESPTGQKFSLTERSVMSSLHHNKAMLPSELAAIEMITNQSMSQVLNKLLDHGYIVRIPSETDKRKVNISLSKEGEETFLKFKHERDEWLLKAIKATCTNEEQQLLKAVITPITKLIDFK